MSCSTSRRWKDQQTGDWKEETDWHNIVLWRSENVAQYLTKGKQVYIEGRLAFRSYDDKDGNKKYVTEVVADDLILLSGQGGRGGEAPSEDASDAAARPVSMPRTAQRPAPAPAAAPAADDFPPGITDDDVPF